MVLTLVVYHITGCNSNIMSEPCVAHPTSLRCVTTECMSVVELILGF